MDDKEVYDKVVLFVTATTGVKAIKSHPDGNRPEGAYLMVNYTGLEEVREHHIDTEYTDDMYAEAAPIVESEWCYSLHAYGDQGTNELRKIRSIARIGGAPHQNLDRRLTLFDVGRINRVPEFINNRWEERANMKIYMRGFTRDSFVIDLIETATAETSIIQLN